MSTHWDEFHRRVQAWQNSGATEHLELAELHGQAFRCQETDPERSLALLTRGRDEFRRLDESWWVLFFEVWRLTALTSYVMDFSQALPLAVELMVRFNSPEGQAHPDRLSVFDNILYTYTNTDPVGFGDEIERGFTSLDALTPVGPVSTRFILYHRWRAYLAAVERWDENYELALRSLNLLDQCQLADDRNWHTAWTLDQHCLTCHKLGRIDELAGHAQHLATLSERGGPLRRTQATAAIWQAVVHRAGGDEQAASRAFHRGLSVLARLERRDSICPDGIAAYDEAAGDLAAALGVRDRELAEVTPKGMAHRACLVQIERCRLLKALGKLADADIAEARRRAGQLRVPAWYAARIDSFGLEQ